ncbi:hypothetical protein [Streptomyces mirabilis]
MTAALRTGGPDGISLADLAGVVTHAANLRITESLVRQLGLREDAVLDGGKHELGEDVGQECLGLCGAGGGERAAVGRLRWRRGQAPVDLGLG